MDALASERVDESGGVAHCQQRSPGHRGAGDAHGQVVAAQVLQLGGVEAVAAAEVGQLGPQGEGRPDELTVKYSEGVDVFVTECQTDTGQLMSIKYGLPLWLYDYTIDTHHTPHYAVGYLMKQIKPRLGMVTHIEYEEDIINETIAGIRAHWDGFFAFGAPDVVTVNVTPDAIWIRKAVLPGLTGARIPDFRKVLGVPEVPEELPLPQPRLPREEQQEQYTREIEIEPTKYYPPDVNRDLPTKLPDPLTMPLKKIMRMFGYDV